MYSWFIFDLGNVVVKLAYERVMTAICAQSEASRDDLVQMMDERGGYRDLERGLVNFEEFHEFLTGRIRYRGDLETFRRVWSDFFAGSMEGIEEVLERARAEYRVAFLSNSNEVHAEVIPRKFAPLFRRDDRFIFSHQHLCAKPDPEMFNRAVGLLGTTAPECLYTDDLQENVTAARMLGMTAFLFEGSGKLLRALEKQKLLAKPETRSQRRDTQ